MISARRDNKFMQSFEIIMISSQENTTEKNGFGHLTGILLSVHFNVGLHQDVMAILSEQLNKQFLRNVFIQIKFHLKERLEF